MMKSRKKALSLALTACLAAGMAWAPARTTEANEALNQVYQRILFDRINEIQRHQQEEREKEEQREREYAKRRQGPRGKQRGKPITFQCPAWGQRKKLLLMQSMMRARML